MDLFVLMVQRCSQVKVAQYVGSRVARLGITTIGLQMNLQPH